MYHLLPCLLVCDSRVSSTLFSTASRHINKSYNYRSGFRHGEYGVRCFRHGIGTKFVLLCVFPAFVRFCVSLVSLVATILGAIHAYQQMNDHRKWEAAYAFWKALGWPRSGPGLPLGASSSAPGTHVNCALTCKHRLSASSSTQHFHTAFVKPEPHPGARRTSI